jgi:hypothetical protein
VNKSKTNAGWGIGTLHMVHNHPPMTDLASKYRKRTSDLTAAHIEFLRNASKTLISPSDLVNLLKAVFTDAPKLIDADTVRNIISYDQRKHRTSGNDAHRVLDILINLQREDPEWYFRYDVDDEGRLTHLFWQSPMSEKPLRTATKS